MIPVKYKEFLKYIDESKKCHSSSFIKFETTSTLILLPKTIYFCLSVIFSGNLKLGGKHCNLLTSNGVKYLIFKDVSNSSRVFSCKLGLFNF